jgi:hypothetical protein
MRTITIVLLMAMAMAIGALAQPSCLLDEPLTDQCLQSIDSAKVEPVLTEYLCTISYKRKLYKKAQ